VPTVATNDVLYHAPEPRKSSRPCATPPIVARELIAGLQQIILTDELAADAPFVQETAGAERPGNDIANL